MFISILDRCCVVIDTLIKHGASLNTEDQNGQTPLHSAIYYNFPEATRLLIKKGSDVNIKLKSGLNILHLAAHCGFEPSLLRLILTR